MGESELEAAHGVTRADRIRPPQGSLAPASSSSRASRDPAPCTDPVALCYFISRTLKPVSSTVMTNDRAMSIVIELIPYAFRWSMMSMIRTATTLQELWMAREGRNNARKGMCRFEERAQR